MEGSTKKMMYSFPESGGPRHHSYSRKDKSLALLCTNFLNIYNREDVRSIGLDDAAKRLGVERRRIYDIVNVLENVGILAKKGKNQYSRLGLDGLPKALNELKEEALKEGSFSSFDGSNSGKVSEDYEDERSMDSTSMGGQDKSSSISSLLQSCSSTKSDKKREKSLGLLTRNFVKLLLTTNNELVLLDEVAKILLGEIQNPSQMQNNAGAKVRRLYDIANVLSSINLIEKTHHPTSRKPAFRWLGINATSIKESATYLDSKKRVFGTDITNTNYKRNKIVTSINDNPNRKPETEMHMQRKCEDLKNGDGSNKMQQPLQLDESSNDIVFGPFSPVAIPKINNTEKNNVKSFQNLESLASTHRPKYHNEVLHDLFAHYMEAWNTWYTEVSQKQPIQLS